MKLNEGAMVCNSLLVIRKLFLFTSPSQDFENMKCGTGSPKLDISSVMCVWAHIYGGLCLTIYLSY